VIGENTDTPVALVTADTVNVLPTTVSVTVVQTLTVRGADDVVSPPNQDIMRFSEPDGKNIPGMKFTPLLDKLTIPALNELVLSGKISTDK